jgi:hypothetical protein
MPACKGKQDLEVAWELLDRDRDYLTLALVFLVAVVVDVTCVLFNAESPLDLPGCALRSFRRSSF